MLQGGSHTEVPLADDWQHLVGGARLEDLAAAIASGSRKIFSQGLRLPLPAAAGRFFPRA